MVTRKAEAEWQGDLKGGQGSIALGSGAFTGPYSFKTRFEGEPGTNPEELIAAAHAGCFSMALSAVLGGHGHQPTRIHTTAKVHLEPDGGGFTIPKIELVCEATVPGIDEAHFRHHAEEAKAGCPVSKLLAAAEITLDAKLVG